MTVKSATFPAVRAAKRAAEDRLSYYRKMMPLSSVKSKAAANDTAPAARALQKRKAAAK